MQFPKPETKKDGGKNDSDSNFLDLHDTFKQILEDLDELDHCDHKTLDMGCVVCEAKRHLRNLEANLRGKDQ